MTSTILWFSRIIIIKILALGANAKRVIFNPIIQFDLFWPNAFAWSGKESSCGLSTPSRIWVDRRVDWEVSDELYFNPVAGQEIYIYQLF